MKQPCRPRCNSILHFVSWSAESPVMLHCVLVCTFAHVMDASVTDGETLFHDVVQQVDPQRHLLMVVARSEGERHLAVSGVHHVFVPLCEVVRNPLQKPVNLCRYS